jgi:hypothetical protein
MPNRDLSGRLREVRVELYGDHGLPVLAEEVRVPARTWGNYERGVVMPAPVLLQFLEVTGASPRWLLTGEPPRYMCQGRAACPHRFAR